MALFAFPFAGMGQGQQTLSEACQQVSVKWKLDSGSCKGDRIKLVSILKTAKPDAISKDYLFRTLGQPNKIQKIFVGYPVNKHFVQYIYYTYKDDCPKIFFEGYGIIFFFDVTETHFIKLEDIEYCG